MNGYEFCSRFKADPDLVHNSTLTVESAARMFAATHMLHHAGQQASRVLAPVHNARN